MPRTQGRSVSIGNWRGSTYTTLARHDSRGVSTQSSLCKRNVILEKAFRSLDQALIYMTCDPEKQTENLSSELNLYIDKIVTIGLQILDTSADAFR